MNYIILIIAGVCGMVVGSYLGKRQRVKKAMSAKNIQTKEKSEKQINPSAGG